ncbi:hypothetical protein J2S34_000361 [Nitrobacter winogradskyi]|nr:hypothetical protein [Nitrobacter winogradskyi]
MLKQKVKRRVWFNAVESDSTQLKQTLAAVTPGMVSKFHENVVSYGPVHQCSDRNADIRNEDAVSFASISALPFAA